MDRVTHSARVNASAAKGRSYRVTKTKVPSHSSAHAEVSTTGHPIDHTTMGSRPPGLDVPEHLRWFESLQSRYKWPDPQWNPIASAISRLETRADDPRLFLGIVGEFSSGKSTLINAFLREDLLKTDILPATTCATTVLEYGPKVDALLRLQDGQEIQRSKSGITFWGRLRRRLLPVSTARELDDTRHFIHRYTSEEEHARTIQRVTVTHPNERLKAGLVIVDTPGINVENPRHATITVDAVTNLCDAVVVIVPAPAACSQTLVRFLKDNLTESAHRCLVFISKIDLIPSRERNRLVAFVFDRLQRECGTFASVLAGAPCFMLNGHNVASISATDSPDAFRQQFVQAEDAVFSILETSRNTVITEHLLAITLTILTKLDHAIRARKDEYARRHDALEENRIPDLGKFVASHKRSYASRIKQATRRLGREVEDVVSEMRERLFNEIEQAILTATSQDELKAAVSSGTEARVRKVFAELTVISKDLHRQISDFTSGCHSEFESEFSSRYRSLTTLGGLITVRDDTVQALSRAQASTLHQASSNASPVIEAVNSGNTAANVGVAAGAAVGTWLIPIPVIGTLIGGGVGWVLGKLFGPSLSDLQQQAVANARQMVAQWAAECGARMQSVVKDHVDGSIAGLDAAIDRYAQAYDERVREMIARDEKEKTLLQQYLGVAERDLSDLRSREEAARRHLTEIRNSLCNSNRSMP